MKLDALVIGAHPDDAEISMGGTILRFVDAGLAVGIVDITRGELGTRGDRATRDAEAEAAAESLGLAVRRNLEQPDGRVQATLEAREALAAIFREYRPELVFAHHEVDLHPDHGATGRLAKEAWFLSGLRRLAEQAGASGLGPGEPHRPRRLYQYMSHVAFEPSFVVDIGAVWERKIEAIRAYKSQFTPQSSEDNGEHFLFGADILQRMESKARYYGEKIGVRYGEAVVHEGPVPFWDPLLPPA